MNFAVPDEFKLQVHEMGSSLFTPGPGSTRRIFISKKPNVGDSQNLDVERDYQEACNQIDSIKKEPAGLSEIRVIKSQQDLDQQKLSINNLFISNEAKQKKAKNSVPISNSQDVWRRGGLSIATQIRSASKKFLNFSESFRFRNLQKPDLDLINDKAANYDALYFMDFLNDKPNLLHKLQFALAKKLNRIKRSLLFRTNMIDQRFIMVLKPDSKSKNIWSFGILAMLLLNFYHSSFQIVFSRKYFDTIGPATLSFLQNGPLIIFFFDLVLNLNTSFYHGGVLITNRMEILKSYLTNGFLNDFAIIFAIILEKSGFEWAKFIQIIQILKINRIFSQISDNLQLSDYYDAFLNLVHLLLKICLTAHLCGLFFIFVAKLQDANESWMSKQNIINENWNIQYFTCLYWAVVTMITLGYGDIVPINVNQRITVIMISLIACGMFAYSFNKIGSIFQTLNESEVLLKRKLQMIRVYLKKRNVSHDLNVKLNRYFQYIFQRELENDAECDQIINQLTPELQKEISLDIYGRLLKETKSFGLNFSKKVLNNLAPYIQQQQYQAEAIILPKDMENQKFFFILDGKVQMGYPVQNQKQNVTIKFLQKGDIFGRQSFFTGQYENFNYISKNIVNIAYLDYKDFIEVLRESPTQLEKYYQKRDQFLFQGIDGFDVQCEICKGFQHKPENCPRVTYNVNQQRIIYLYNNDDRIQKDRAKVERHQRKRFCSRNIRSLHIDAIDILTDIKYYRNPETLQAQIDLIEKSLRNEHFQEEIRDTFNKLDTMVPPVVRRARHSLTITPLGGKSHPTFAQFDEVEDFDKKATLSNLNKIIQKSDSIESNSVTSKSQSSQEDQKQDITPRNKVKFSEETVEREAARENNNFKRDLSQSIGAKDFQQRFTLNRLQTSLDGSMQSNQKMSKLDDELGKEFEVQESINETEKIQQYDYYFVYNNFSKLKYTEKSVLQEDKSQRKNAQNPKSGSQSIIPSATQIENAKQKNKLMNSSDTNQNSIRLIRTKSQIQKLYQVQKIKE